MISDEIKKDIEVCLKKHKLFKNIAFYKESDELNSSSFNTNNGAISLMWSDMTDYGISGNCGAYINQTLFISYHVKPKKKMRESELMKNGLAIVNCLESAHKNQTLFKSNVVLKFVKGNMGKMLEKVAVQGKAKIHSDVFVVQYNVKYDI